MMKPTSMSILKTPLTKTLASGLVLTCLLFTSFGYAQPAMTEQQKVIHVLNRLGFGPDPGQFKYVQKLGVQQYIKQQLNVQPTAYPAALAKEVESLPTRQTTLQQYYDQFKRDNQANLNSSDARAAEQAMINRIQALRKQFWVTDNQARLIRAVNNPQQLQEVLTDFWFNHFNVSYGRDIMQIWVGRYEDQAIRPYTMSRFYDLLLATSKHPAMMYYLDNWLNTAPGSPGAKGVFKGLNENYAREVMELHTLGVDAGYTQKDVTELARVLTGWGLANTSGLKGLRTGQGFIDDFGQRFAFDPSRHDNQPKVLLGKTIPPSGPTEVEVALKMLAKHPATAERISAKLAQYFVMDNPPASLVAKMKQKYLETDGNIKSVLTVMFDSPEFWSPAAYQAKFKNPFRYYISALRLNNVHPMENPQYLMDVLRNDGMPLYTCTAPTGYKNTVGAWLSPDALSQRINFSMSFTLRRLPLKPATTVTAPVLVTNWGGPLSRPVGLAMNNAQPQQQAGLFIGSPDFMKY
jgi:uncharacterized protein (DUF1800 family)